MKVVKCVSSGDVWWRRESGGWRMMQRRRRREAKLVQCKPKK